MFKGGFDSVQNGVIDVIQPQYHQLWDYTNGCSANLERNELSQWVVENHVPEQVIGNQPETGPQSQLTGDHKVVAQLDRRSNTLLYNTRCAEPLKNNIVPTLLGELRSSNSPNNEIKEMASQEDEPSLNFMTLLLECAVAISVDNLGEAHRILLEVTQMATPYGPSCAERIVAYFAKAMSSRVINSWLGICSPLIDHNSVHTSFQVFNNIAPFFKFAHFTCNQAILEAFQTRDRVHIIDLDIMQGLQWPAFFHILATRNEGPPHVRMTGMGTSIDHLIETGKQLSNFAKRIGMSFEFHPVARKFGEINDVSMLQIRRGEALGVHWLQHSLYDATGPDWKTMRLLHELSPKVITLVEQEICHGGSFLDRFVGSLHYYSTIFDSLGAYFPSDDPSRHRVEHGLLYREINNILAIGGPARSGEDKFRDWRSEVLKNGFMQVPISTNSMAQAQLILNMFPPSQGYSLVQGDGTLKLGWKGTSLYSVSAWTSSPNYST